MNGTNTKTDDHPGVAVRPPILYLGSILAGVLLGHLRPAAAFPAAAPEALGWILGLAVTAGGVVGLFLGWREFIRWDTEIDPLKPTTRLIVTGPYRYSRNPLYVSLSLVQAGIGLLLDNLWVLGLLIPTLLVVRYGVIAREERYLEAKFGAEYLRYRESVNRWWGRKKGA